jgi:hypothetical protein
MRADDINFAAWKLRIGRRLIGVRLLPHGSRCDEDDDLSLSLSRRQIGPTRRAGAFLDDSRTFVSSGLPERAPGVRG